MLFILIFTGFVGAKFGAIKAEGKKAFSDFLVYIVTPAMILDSYISSEFDKQVLSNLVWAFVLATILLLTGLGITFVLTAKMKGKDMAIMRFACTFPNAAYMGFPLVRALFGAEGLLYGSAFVTMFNVIVWTIGYAMVSGNLQWKAVAKKVLVTPTLISVVIGLAIYLARIPVPEIVATPISLLGGVNTALSMIITGMIIAATSFKKLLANKKLFLAIAIRMFITPFACVGIFMLLSHLGLWAALGLSAMVIQVVLIQESCPTAAITSVFAVQFNQDEDLAAGAVVISTLISIVTLPVLALLMSMML